ncbi:Bug family tripartite tricarboxylate transporter substrate binding protein, partial [Ottowia sp.]|uniref:Bug family tripartite tricarboxylate transporter substrate binding protein n=1 Tax=Ottowia sp. TaxID=1898956 RepID=UPI0039E274E4
KPITLIVGYPAGGSTDLTGRTLGEALSRQLGVPVVIDNVGGAGGAIGAQKAANAAPDGYTLFVGANNEVAIARLINKSVKYTLQDFTPIGLVATQPMVLVASASSGVKNIDQFIAKVKAAPGKYSYGSSGVGTALHLSGETIKERAGLFMTHIPYRGVAPLTTDLIGGNLDFGVFVLSSGLPHIKAGKVVALGTTEARRSPITPDIPALAEDPRLKGMDIGTWFALLGPAKLPEPVVARLKTALGEALKSPEFRKKMEESGSVVAPASGGVDLGKFMQAEAAKYQKIVQFAKIEQ